MAGRLKSMVKHFNEMVSIFFTSAVDCEQDQSHSYREIFKTRFVSITHADE